MSDLYALLEMDTGDIWEVTLENDGFNVSNVTASCHVKRNLPSMSHVYQLASRCGYKIITHIQQDGTTR